MFMVTTDTGQRVFSGISQTVPGISEEEAVASANERNERATELGIKTRYVAAPYTDPS